MYFGAATVPLRSTTYALQLALAASAAAAAARVPVADGWGVREELPSPRGDPSVCSTLTKS